MTVDLPAEPVDQFTFEWWFLDYLDRYLIRHGKAVFHVHTPWSVFDSKHPNSGAPFNHQWAIYDDDGRLAGRNEGWGWPLKLNWEDTCATREEAVKDALLRTRKRIARLMEEIKTLEESIHAFEAGP
jgi:hypothetical protein